MNDIYKVIVYHTSESLEIGLNQMYEEGYDLSHLTRGVSGYITAIYKKRDNA